SSRQRRSDRRPSAAVRTGMEGTRERAAHSRPGGWGWKDGFHGRWRLGSHAGAARRHSSGAGAVVGADAPDQPGGKSGGGRPNDPAGRSGAAAGSARGRRSGQVRPKRGGARTEGFVIKLLIADDSALMRKLLEGIFREEGDFDIRLARNGAEALELVRSFDPAVVTLDVQMPGMDGLACLGRIMIESPRPVVMISALTEEGAEATLEAIELGAVDFVAKPGGAVSLGIDRLRPVLVEKVRAAAKARIRPTLRPRERIRHQFRGAGVSPQLQH